MIDVSHSSEQQFQNIRYVILKTETLISLSTC